MQNWKGRSRLLVDIPPETKQSLRDLVPQGMLQPLFLPLILELVEMLKENQEETITGVMMRKIRAKDILEAFDGRLPKKEK